MSKLPAIHSRDDFPQLLTTLGLTGVGVEVGTYRGDYAAHLLYHWSGSLVCVDPWIHQDDWVDLLNGSNSEMDAVYEEACRKLSPWVSSGRCQIERTTSLIAADLLRDRRFDFVYLDARHDYPHVWDDLTAWAPLVTRGGILGGHDYLNGQLGPTVFDVKRAVNDWLRTVDRSPDDLVVTQESSYPSWFIRL